MPFLPLCRVSPYRGGQTKIQARTGLFVRLLACLFWAILSTLSTPNLTPPPNSSTHLRIIRQRDTIHVSDDVPRERIFFFLCHRPNTPRRTTHNNTNKNKKDGSTTTTTFPASCATRGCRRCSARWQTASFVRRRTIFWWRCRTIEGLRGSGPDLASSTCSSSTSVRYDSYCNDVFVVPVHIF